MNKGILSDFKHGPARSETHQRLMNSLTGVSGYKPVEASL
jgi:hypothetical protein